MEVIVQILNKTIRTTFNASAVERQLIDHFQLKLPFLTNSMAVKALVAESILPDSWLTRNPKEYHGNNPDDKFEQGCEGSKVIINAIPEEKIQETTKILTHTWSSLFVNIVPVSSTTTIDLSSIILHNSMPEVKQDKVFTLQGPMDRALINGKVYCLSAVLDTSGTNLLDTAEKELNQRFSENQKQLLMALTSYQKSEKAKLAEKLASIQYGILVPTIAHGLIREGIQVCTSKENLMVYFPFKYRPVQVSENNKTYTIPPRLAHSMSRNVLIKFTLFTKSNSISTYPLASCELLKDTGDLFDHYHLSCWGEHQWGTFNIMVDIYNEKLKLEKLLGVIYLNSLASKNPAGLPSYLKVRRAAIAYTQEQLKIVGKEPTVHKGWLVND